MKSDLKKCKCGETDQSKMVVNKGYINNLCRDCQRVDNNQRRYEKKKLLVYYKGGECEECAYNKYLQALCFHHIDPTTKHSDFNNMRGWPIERAKAEVDKCQLLCQNCHTFTHHGKDYEDMVPKYIRTTEPFLCKYCAQTDEDKMKMNASRGKKYLYKTICKECYVEEGVQRERKHKEYLVEHMGGCCSKCQQEYHQSIYEFHHLDPDKKDPNFDSMNGWSFDRAKKELENCIMACRNCHSEIHAEIQDEIHHEEVI